MKILTTYCYVHGEQEQLLHDRGLYDGHHQYRIYCRARGLKHANELCQDVGGKVFNSMFASICSNPEVKSFFATHSEVAYCFGSNIGLEKNFVTDLEIAALKQRQGDK